MRGTVETSKVRIGLRCDKVLLSAAPDAFKSLGAVEAPVQGSMGCMHGWRLQVAKVGACEAGGTKGCYIQSPGVSVGPIAIGVDQGKRDLAIVVAAQRVVVEQVLVGEYFRRLVSMGGLWFRAGAL